MSYERLSGANSKSREQLFQVQRTVCWLVTDVMCLTDVTRTRKTVQTSLTYNSKCLAAKCQQAQIYIFPHFTMSVEAPWKSISLLLFFYKVSNSTKCT